MMIYSIHTYVIMSQMPWHTQKKNNNNKIWENTSKSHIQPAAMAVKIICILCCFLYSSLLFFICIIVPFFCCCLYLPFPSLIRPFFVWWLWIMCIRGCIAYWRMRIYKKNNMKWIENEVGGRRRFFFCTLLSVLCLSLSSKNLQR